MLKQKFALFHIILILSLHTATAFAVDKDVYFIGGAFGKTYANVQDVSNEGATMEISIGQYFNNLDVSFEVAYAELDNYELTKSITDGKETSKFDISAVKFVAAKHLIFSKTIYASLRGGAIYWREEREKTTFDLGGAVTSELQDKESGVNIYLGLGYAISITPETRLNITVETFKTENTEFANALLGIIFSI